MATYTPVAIPAIPSNVDPALRNVLNAIKESVEVRMRQRGNALDSSPTFRDLLDAGLITLKDGVTIGGQSYSVDELIGLAGLNLPGWVSSDLAPPTPSGLTVTANTANAVLSWTLSAFDLYGETQVWRAASNALGVGIHVGSTAGSTYGDSLPANGVTHYYWIRDVSLNGQLSDFNAVGGTSTSPAPSAATLSASVSNTDGMLTLSWPTPVSNLAIQYYVLQYGGSAWNTGTTQLAIVNANNYKVAAWWIGALTFRIKAVDINGNYSPEATTSATITAPGAPVSFTQSIIGAKVQLNWSAVTSGSLPTRRYEVRQGASYAAGSFIAQVDGTSLRVNVDWVGARTFWVAAIDTAGNTGTSASVDVTITVPTTPVPTSAFSGETALVSWPAVTASLPIDYYKVTQGAGRIPVATIYGTQATDTVDWGGAASRTYYVKAYDLNGNVSGEGSTTLTSTPRSAPSVTGAITAGDSSYTVSWTVPSAGSLPVAYYEILDGTTPLGRTSSLFFSAKVFWSGSKTFNVKATDVGGVVGATGSAAISVSAPSAPTVTAQVVDNNVLLYWTTPSATLPIATYSIKRGATWGTATNIGDKSGGFTTVFETSGGTFTYWIAAVDTAGNVGTPSSVTATVAQPPDYVLKANYTSDLAGTKSNAFLNTSTTLMLPISPTETFAQHFTTRTWSTVQDQLNAGYPYYIQPSQSPGYYEEVLDYGTALAASRVTVSWLLQTMAGTLTAQCDISTSLDNVSYTAYTNVTQLYAINFRYIKVRVTVTATSGTGVGTLSNIKIVLDSKLKTITGMVSCLSSDSGGTTVYLTDDRLVGGTKVFVDVDAIQLTPQYNATYPGAVALYDFTDTANPLSFKALMYDNAGNRISGTASYMVRGF